MACPKERETLRKPKYPIEPLILNRWSPRSMTAESISDDELFTLFEAARWAPSSYNNQPWRIFYAKRDTPEWPLFFDLLIEFNQSWCKNAAALICLASKKVFDHNGKPARTHSFDTGAAWMSLALEGASLGLVVHGMEGFDWERAAKTLQLPEDYAIEAMAAIGKPAPAEKLSPELREKEKPSLRRPMEEIVFEGIYREKKSSKP